MKKLFSILILLFLCSCIHTNVVRVGRHERVITATGINNVRLYTRIKRRAQRLDPPCHNLRFFNIEEEKVEALCITYQYNIVNR